MDDPGLARETIELFLDETSLQLATLHQHLRESNAEAARRSAHQLKGGCLTVGATQMADICEELESACENRSCHDLSRLAEALAREFLEVKREVHHGPWEGKPASHSS